MSISPLPPALPTYWSPTALSPPKCACACACMCLQQGLCTCSFTWDTRPRCPPLTPNRLLPVSARLHLSRRLLWSPWKKAVRLGPSSLCIFSFTVAFVTFPHSVDGIYFYCLLLSASLSLEFKLHEAGPPVCFVRGCWPRPTDGQALSDCRWKEGSSPPMLCAASWEPACPTLEMPVASWLLLAHRLSSLLPPCTFLAPGELASCGPS